MDPAEILKKGGVGVIATDTLYGLVAHATDKKAVERIYKLKGRTPTKPCIILISSLADLEQFKIKPNEKQAKVLAKYWPGSVSVILPCPYSEFAYLHRGTNSLAFRFPADAPLTEFVKATGPLIAPSANPEGLPPAVTIKAAKDYFGRDADFYIDAGKREGLPSTLIEISKSGAIKILRKGIAKIDNTH